MKTARSKSGSRRSSPTGRQSNRVTKKKPNTTAVKRTATPRPAAIRSSSKRSSSAASSRSATVVNSEAPQQPAVANGAFDAEEEEEEDMDSDCSSDEGTGSVFGDLIEQLTDYNGLADDPDAFTSNEAAFLRHQLHLLGPTEFARRTISEGIYTLRKLLTAFNIRAPAFLDEAYPSMLQSAIYRELHTRPKLAVYNSVDDAVELIRRSSNIVCLTGAGISTSLGIPDFRSKGTGLYAQLEHLGLSDPQEVFNIDQFRADPNIFYSVAKDILPSTDKFTPTHAFIRMLQDRDKLLTNYSQNIDNLEAAAGIRPEKLIQCHGSFATATCIECGFKAACETIYPEMKKGIPPSCPECVKRIAREMLARSNGNGAANGGRRKRSRGRDGKKKRRNGGFSDDDDDDNDPRYDIPTPGVMKPDITFFGEALSDDFGQRFDTHDKMRADLVIVIGTSLKVRPVSEIVDLVPRDVPQIYISRTPVEHLNFDIDMLGDCDVVVAELCRRLGWNLDHEMVPRDQVVETRQEGVFPSRHIFREVPPE